MDYELNLLTTTPGGFIMKKLITVSILTAAMAASTAFAQTPKDSKGNEGSKAAPIYLVKQSQLAKENRQAIAQAMNFFSNAVPGDNTLIKLNVMQQKKKAELYTGRADFLKKINPIKIDDLKLLVSKANKEAGGRYLFLSGNASNFILASIDARSSDPKKAPVLGVAITIKGKQALLETLASDDKRLKKATIDLRKNAPSKGEVSPIDGVGNSWK